MARGDKRTSLAVGRSPKVEYRSRNRDLGGATRAAHDRVGVTPRRRFRFADIPRAMLMARTTAHGDTKTVRTRRSLKNKRVLLPS